MNDVQRQNYRGNEAALAWRAEGGTARGDERAASFETEKQGIAHWITREVAEAWAACGAFEWVALGYLATSSALIAAFAEHLAHPVKLIGVQTLVAVVIVALCWIEARGGTDRNICPTSNYQRDPFAVLHHHQISGVTQVVQLVNDNIYLRIKNSRKNQTPTRGADKRRQQSADGVCG